MYMGRHGLMNLESVIRIFCLLIIGDRILMTQKVMYPTYKLDKTMVDMSHEDVDVDVKEYKSTDSRRMRSLASLCQYHALGAFI